MDGLTRAVPDGHPLLIAANAMASLSNPAVAMMNPHQETS